MTKVIVGLFLFLMTNLAFAEDLNINKKAFHVTCYESKIDVTEIDANEISIDAFTPFEGGKGDAFADGVKLHGLCSVKSNSKN